MSQFKIGDRVHWRMHLGRARPAGVIVEDKGVMTHPMSPAPLAAQWPPDRVWVVEFDTGGKYEDRHGCWEADLVLAERPQAVTL